MTPRGSAIWVALAVLLAAGFFESVLTRFGVRRGSAALWSLAIGAGGFAGVGALNLGGGLAAALWAVLLLHKGPRSEVGRGMTAAVAGGTLLYALAPGAWLVAPIPATPLGAGLATGVTVYLLAGPGRASLAAVLLAGPLAGLAAWATVHAVGMPGTVQIGGGGAYGAQAIACVVAAALGELSARLHRVRVCEARGDGGAAPEGSEEAGGRLP